MGSEAMWIKQKGAGAALLLAACFYLTPALAEPLPCDDGIKTAFRPDTETTVIAVRQVKKGEELKAPDAPQPVTAATDLCLVKLLVGPGVTAEKDKNARSYSEGIGIEVWLPTQANWNERIRNYGGGTTLVDWVEKGAAPGEILLASRDNSLSYPVCVYPLRTTWNGGDAKQASSYGCK